MCVKALFFIARCYILLHGSSVSQWENTVMHFRDICAQLHESSPPFPLCCFLNWVPWHWVLWHVNMEIPVSTMSSAMPSYFINPWLPFHYINITAIVAFARHQKLFQCDWDVLAWNVEVDQTWNKITKVVNLRKITQFKTENTQWLLCL